MEPAEGNTTVQAQKYYFNAVGNAFGISCYTFHGAGGGSCETPQREGDSGGWNGVRRGSTLLSVVLNLFHLFQVSENSVSLTQEGQPPHVFAFDNVGSTDSAESRG